MSKTKWVDLEPNERQGNVQWMPRGYKVRKDTLNEICQDILLDIGFLDPITYNHIKWAMQRAILDQEVLSVNNQEKRSTQ